MDNDQLSPEDGAAPPVAAASNGASAPKVSEADLHLLANFIPQLAWIADRDGSIF